MPSPQENAQILAPDHQSFLYEGIVGGISRAQASHLVPKNMWWDSLNFRFSRGKITQIESLANYTTIGDGIDLGDVQAILPVNLNAASATLMILTKQFLYKLNPKTKVATVLNPSGLLGPYTFVAPWVRWATFSDATNFYFTNSLNKVRKYNASTNTLSDVVTTGPVYCALYICDFHGHMMLANVFDGTNTYPNRIAWSDVNDYADFAPTTVNEADFFQLEAQAGNALNGAMITGMEKLGDYLFIYTPTSIWQVQYVGLPNVMITQAKMRDIGSIYPYGLTAVLDSHYFVGQGGFYRFDGNSVQSIGEQIWDYFVNDQHPHYDNQNKTYCSLNTTKHEITWYYCSNSSGGEIDKGVVYNYIEQLWFPIEGRGINSSMYTPIRTYTTMDDLTGTTYAGLTGSMDGLSGNTAFTLVLHGLAAGKIVQEVDPNFTDWPNVLPEKAPYLETGDIHYGTLNALKELDSIRLDAAWLFGSGVEVELWGRFYITEPDPLAIQDWNVDYEYPVGSVVGYQGRYWIRQFVASRQLIYVFVTDGGADYDVNRLLIFQGGQMDTVRSGTNYAAASALVDSGLGQITGVVVSNPPTYWFVKPDVFVLQAPLDMDHPGLGAQFDAVLEQQSAPGVIQSEWTVLVPVVNPRAVIGIWQPDFKHAGRAGWVNAGNRKSSATNINRVHRWRFTFLGPTNRTGSNQPQQARFHCFEEKVYMSPSEL